jgi:hypothetical protein
MSRNARRTTKEVIMKIYIEQNGFAQATIKDAEGNVLLKYEISDCKLEIDMIQLIQELRNLSTLLHSLNT